MNDEIHNNDINSITERIIGCAFSVFNTLKSGFLEKVYENALVIELKEMGLIVDQQKPIKVYYKNQSVGDYFADLLVDEKVIVELKAIKQIDSIHISQVLNYLNASGLKCGLILNFGKTKLEIKRVVNGIED